MEKYQRTYWNYLLISSETNIIYSMPLLLAICQRNYLYSLLIAKEVINILYYLPKRLLNFFVNVTNAKEVIKYYLLFAKEVIEIILYFFVICQRSY